MEAWELSVYSPFFTSPGCSSLGDESHCGRDHSAGSPHSSRGEGSLVGLPEAALGVRMMLSEKHPSTNWKSDSASQGLGRIWVAVLAAKLGKTTGELGFFTANS